MSKKGGNLPSFLYSADAHSDAISRLDDGAIDGVDAKQGAGKVFPIVAAEVAAVLIGEIVAAVEVPNRDQQPLFAGLAVGHPFPGPPGPPDRWQR